MGLKHFVFLSYTLLLILSTECALKLVAAEIGSNNQHIKCIATERRALLKLKSSLQSSYNSLLRSWGREGHEDDCCKWSGVQCSNTTGHVTRLDLSRSYKACVINASLVELRHLSHLNLSHNHHNNCQIPEFIGHLNKLEELDLSFSNFGGRIPHQMGKISLLKLLDLSFNNFNGSLIPESFNFLGNLIHLSFQASNIGGKIQDQLKNLSKLQSLDLSRNLDHAYCYQLEWVSHLYSLRYLSISKFNLSKAVDWGQSLLKLPHLIELQMWYSSLPTLDATSPTMSPTNASSSLSLVDLAGNGIPSSIFKWLLNFNDSLSEICLRDNLLRGSIPNELGNMPFLFYLDMGGNKLEGELPSSFVYPIGENHPLRYLSLSNNGLKGNLSNIITRLHKLIYLDLSLNSFYGVISEDHLSNFTNMKHLFLDSNNLTLSLGPHWIPPFQLYSIGLGSCNLGPQFPHWLQTQTSFYFLDISSNEILGTLPNWFWNLSSNLLYLYISNNKIYGEVPSGAFSYNPAMAVDLSSNNFEGPLPVLNPGILYMDLSKNNFVGTLSSLCKYEMASVLELSENDLSGELPQCWKEKSFTNLFLLSLSSNNLTGNIHHPICPSSSSRLKYLQLSNNSFSGELPSTLSKCTGLELLDVASNKISGSIPKWIGNLWDLKFLILRSNQFRGSIPPNLCWLYQIRVMDFSDNNLTGCVLNCLHNSSILTSREPPAYELTDSLWYPLIYFTTFKASPPHKGIYLRYHVKVKWKGGLYEYNDNLRFVTMVDFSGNKLQGEIPEEFGSLVGLVQLNLSNNNLTGSIPRRIGEMQKLEVLDSSLNHLSGEIPQSISNLSFLNNLNLSSNCLSGQIPKGTQIQTQDATSFMGNPGLCGDPLPKCHQEDQATPPSSNFGFGGHKKEEEEEFLSNGFYISMSVGFVIGFWGVLGCLLFHKTWGSAYFHFLNKVADKVYVRSALINTRNRRRMRVEERRRKI